MEAITNSADPSDPWVRGFLRRLGYHLAAEWQEMPECELRDIVGEAANDLIDLVHAEDDAAEAVRQSPTLRVVD